MSISSDGVVKSEFYFPKLCPLPWPLAKDWPVKKLVPALPLPLPVPNPPF